MYYYIFLKTYTPEKTYLHLMVDEDNYVYVWDEGRTISKFPAKLSNRKSVSKFIKEIQGIYRLLLIFEGTKKEHEKYCMGLELVK